MVTDATTCSEGHSRKLFPVLLPGSVELMAEVFVVATRQYFESAVV
jgi:hypothetical protein